MTLIFRIELTPEVAPGSQVVTLELPRRRVRFRRGQVDSAEVPLDEETAAQLAHDGYRVSAVAAGLVRRLATKRTRRRRGAEKETP